MTNKQSIVAWKGNNCKFMSTIKLKISSYMFMNNYCGNVILCIPYPKESEFSNLYKTKLYIFNSLIKSFAILSSENKT